MPFIHPFTSLKHPLAAWTAILCVTIGWDLGGQDLAVMRLFGTTQGFPLRTHPLLSSVLHDGLRQLALLLLLLLALWAMRPDATDRLPRRQRLAVLGGVLLSLLAVNLIKWQSATSCPWDLAEFGGSARYITHWSWGVADGGSGRCFPGGHASSALAFAGVALPALVAGRRSGWWLLTGILTMGAVAGGTQTLRGAHYPSHTLWTLVICLGCSIMVWALAARSTRADAH